MVASCSRTSRSSWSACACFFAALAASLALLCNVLAALARSVWHWCSSADRWSNDVCSDRACSSRRAASLAAARPTATHLASSWSSRASVASKLARDAGPAGVPSPLATPPRGLRPMAWMTPRRASVESDSSTGTATSASTYRMPEALPPAPWPVLGSLPSPGACVLTAPEEKAVPISPTPGVARLPWTTVAPSSSAMLTPLGLRRRGGDGLPAMRMAERVRRSGLCDRTTDPMTARATPPHRSRTLVAGTRTLSSPPATDTTETAPVPPPAAAPEPAVPDEACGSARLPSSQYRLPLRRSCRYRCASEEPTSFALYWRTSWNSVRLDRTCSEASGRRSGTVSEPRTQRWA